MPGAEVVAEYWLILMSVQNTYRHRHAETAVEEWSNASMQFVRRRSALRRECDVSGFLGCATNDVSGLYPIYGRSWVVLSSAAIVAA